MYVYIYIYITFCDMYYITHIDFCVIRVENQTSNSIERFNVGQPDVQF